MTANIVEKDYQIAPLNTWAKYISIISQAPGNIEV